MNPRLLYQVNPVGQEMAAMMQNRAGSNQPNMSAEVDAEIAQEMGGGNSSISTPMGLVPTSPQQQLSSGDMSI
jgi:hypothetical protein